MNALALPCLILQLFTKYCCNIYGSFSLLFNNIVTNGFHFCFSDDKSEILLKTENLTCLEILEQFNRFVSAKAPSKEAAVGPILQTKAEKAALSGKSSRKRSKK